MRAGGATDARHGRHDAGPAGQARGAEPAQRRHGVAAARVREVRGRRGHGVQAGAEAPRVGFDTAAQIKCAVTALPSDLITGSLAAAARSSSGFGLGCRLTGHGRAAVTGEMQGSHAWGGFGLRSKRACWCFATVRRGATHSKRQGTQSHIEVQCHSNWPATRLHGSFTSAPIAGQIIGSQRPGAGTQPAAVKAAVYAAPYLLRALGAVPAGQHGLFVAGQTPAEAAKLTLHNPMTGSKWRPVRHARADPSEAYCVKQNDGRSSVGSARPLRCGDRAT